MQIIAHRGGAGLFPENTLAAFSAAAAQGCDGAELDVQLCADGTVVVHHDYRLNPAFARRDGAWLRGRTPRIKDLTFAQLQDYDLGRADPATDYARDHPALTPVDGARAPALAQVIAAVHSLNTRRTAPFELFVELKSDAGADSADPVALADAALTVVLDAQFLDRAVFVGFDWRGLLRVKKIAPQARCWFTTDRLDGDPRPVLDAIRAHGGDGWFAHCQDATPGNVAQARARGLKVGAWTVNDPAEMARLGVLDALCTDRPDLFAPSGQGTFPGRSR